MWAWNYTSRGRILFFWGMATTLLILLVMILFIFGIMSQLILYPMRGYEQFMVVLHYMLYRWNSLLLYMDWIIFISKLLIKMSRKLLRHFGSVIHGCVIFLKDFVWFWVLGNPLEIIIYGYMLFCSRICVIYFSKICFVQEYP